MKKRKTNVIRMIIDKWRKAFLFRKLRKLGVCFLSGLGDSYIFKVSDNGQKAVISYPTYDAYGYHNVGQVVTFYKHDGTWYVGNRLGRFTEESNLYFGQDIAFNADGTVLAISAPGYPIQRKDASGRVFIAIFNGYAFQMEDTQIDCPISQSAIMGTSIALDATGKKLIATVNYLADDGKTTIKDIALFIRNKGITMNPKSGVRYNLSGLMRDGLYSRRFNHIVALNRYDPNGITIQHQRNRITDVLYFN